MRIIAGTARGRRLAVPAGRSVRPTADRAREALFSILGPRVAGARVLDLFAGTGALGLEALSRGAASAVLVDSQPQALAILARNVEACGFGDRARILARDLDRGLAFLEPLAGPQGFSLVFLDPPYRQGLAARTLEGLATGRLVAAGGWVVAEEAAGQELPALAGRLAIADQRRYGEAGFWLYLCG
ncbi:MAG: 16S rRNA (guanine(966)-N(2))-methyltransferase RsmD [Thermodesulfobacteriota bacterium]